MANRKRITNSNMDPDGWNTCVLGRKYYGNIDPKTEMPDGLGIMKLNSDHLYVGEFQQGRRHGRGFLLGLEDHSHTEQYFQRYSYEQVMSTAEFDSCGRVVHTGPSGEWKTELVEDFRYVKEQDGLWENDALVSEIDDSILKQQPWTDYELISSGIGYHDKAKMEYTHQTPLSSLEPGGVLNVNRSPFFVTPYGDDGLLVLTNSDKKMPFIVRMDGEPYFSSFIKDNHLPCHFFALNKLGNDYVLRPELCVPQKNNTVLPMLKPFWKEAGWTDQSDEERILTVKLKDLDEALKHCNLCRDTLTVLYPDKSDYWFKSSAELMWNFGIKEKVESNIERHGGYMIDEWQFVDERQSPMDLRSKVKFTPE